MGTDKKKIAAFIFAISESSEAKDFSELISDRELSRFGNVGHCISKIRRILPKNIDSTCMQLGTSIHLVLTSEDVQQDAFDSAVDQVKEVVASLNKLILSMKSNVNSDSPLPDKALSIRSGDVEAIKAFLRADMNSGLQTEVEISGEPVVLLKTVAADFTPAVESSSKKKRLRGRVVGLRRDDVKGHILLVSEEEIRVRLPIESWPFSKIANALSLESDFEGTIVKSIDGGWRATDDACLHSQADAFPTGAEK